MSEPSVREIICKLLSITNAQADLIIQGARTLYIEKMTERFSNVKCTERLKRTNPFLLRMRGINTVKNWAEMQVQSALFASEEEAAGHLLELVAQICHPNSKDPDNSEDMDYEVHSEDKKKIEAYQVKMSWDCMPMSSRKNLSKTVRENKEMYAKSGIEYVGYFAPCYGKATTTTPKGQDYVSHGSKEFWVKVGGGKKDFDVNVGEVLAILCSEFRKNDVKDLIATLTSKLEECGKERFGLKDGSIDFNKLFRSINK